MSDNLRIYNELRTPPPAALRPIAAGRMKGKTDINPMWRLQALTSLFGPCGIGWKYTIDQLWLEPGAKGEVAAFAQISLYYKDGDTWSEPIPGIGGNSFVANEKSGLYTSDECYKMALTDAISVACKALGMAGDIYWQNDPTKYSKVQQDTEPKKASNETVNRLYQAGEEKRRTMDTVRTWVIQVMGKPPEELPEAEVQRLIKQVEGWPC